MYDVTILGAGIFGLSCAFAALKAGAKVQIIDPNGVGFGASGGIVGALAPHVPENWNSKKEFQLESLLYQEAFWAEVEALSGRSSSYGRTGRIQPILEPHQIELAQKRAENAVSLWQAKAQWEVIEAPRAHPFLPQSPTGYYIHDTLSARLAPRRATLALAAACKRLGAAVSSHGPLDGLVIEASGWWGLKQLNQDTGKEVGNGVKGQAALFSFNAPDAAQVFANTLHFIAHDDGTLAVGSTSERQFDDPHQTDTALDALLEKAFAILPGLKSAALLQRWAGVRPRVKTRAPMVGPHPTRPGHWIANGGFKIGFGVAPLLGEMLVAAALEGRDRIPPHFRVEASFD